MPKINVIVRKREGVEFEGEVFAISSINEIGPFDILQDHANFICTIKDNLTIHHTEAKKQDIKLENGVLRAKGNKIEVFVGI